MCQILSCAAWIYMYIYMYKNTHMCIYIYIYINVCVFLYIIQMYMYNPKYDYIRFSSTVGSTVWMLQELSAKLRAPYEIDKDCEVVLCSFQVNGRLLRCYANFDWQEEWEGGLTQKVVDNILGKVHTAPRFCMKTSLSVT